VPVVTTERSRTESGIMARKLVRQARRQRPGRRRSGPRWERGRAAHSSCGGTRCDNLTNYPSAHPSELHGSLFNYNYCIIK
jgi:hypothetical protein